MTARQVLAAAMTETDLMAAVRTACRHLRLLAYHTHDSRRSEPGFPDLVIVGRRVIYRELKTQRGRLSRHQKEWLAALQEAGQDATVWRPSDWLAGEITRELQEVAHG